MKKANGLIIGALFILVGVLYAGSALDLFDFSILFPGWWTLFIIIPCGYALLKKNTDKTGPTIGLIIGLCFLINAQDFDFNIRFWPLIVAVLCIAIGVKLIFPEKKKAKKHFEFVYNSGNDEREAAGSDTNNTYSKNDGGFVNVSTILGGKEIRVDNECFTGADMTVIMGAVDLDLRNAIISEDVYIDISAIMGGVDIYLPPNVRIVTDSCTTIMGGIDVNTTYANFHGADDPKVIITGTCIMGGIDIK